MNLLNWAISIWEGGLKCIHSLNGTIWVGWWKKASWRVLLLSMGDNFMAKMRTFKIYAYVLRRVAPTLSPLLKSSDFTSSSERLEEISKAWDYFSYFPTLKSYSMPHSCTTSIDQVCAIEKRIWKWPKWGQTTGCKSYDTCVKFTCVPIESCLRGRKVHHIAFKKPLRDHYFDTVSWMV